jgi:hypothetical protein
VGGCQVTVLTAPVPFRAGPVDVSVLVQDAATAAPKLDCRVTVVARPLDHHGPEITAHATAEQATNRLLQSAHFELPSAGRWQFEVQVEDGHGPARTTLEVEAVEPLPRWRDLLFWITLPAWPILLFGLHEVLRHRQRSCRAGSLSDGLPRHDSEIGRGDHAEPEA